MGNPYQKFAKDTVVIGIANILIGLSGLILLPLLTKTLGPHDYGIWTQVNITISLILGFVGLGLPYAMTRFLAAKTNKEEIQDEFYSVFCFVFIATLIASFILIMLANFFAKAFFRGAIDIVRITALIISVWSLDWVYLSLFRSFRQMKRYSIFVVADAYGQIGLIAYLISNGYGLFSILLSVLFIKVMVFFILSYSVKLQIGIKRPHFSKLKEYLNFGLPTIPGNISSWIVASSDRYVIGYFLGMTSVGVYSAGYNLGSVIFMPIGVLGFILPPTLSKLYDEGKTDKVKNHLSYSLKYFLALAIPFVFGVSLLGKQVLRIFSTPEIAIQGYYIIPLIALSSLFYGVYVVVGHILILVKKTKIVGATWGISALVNLLLNILIVPHVGILGTAITTLIAYSLVLVIIVHYSFKEFRFNIEWSFIFKSLIASVIMSLAIWRITLVGTLDVVLTVVLGVVLGMVIYGAILFLLKGFSEEEFKFFKGLFQTSALSTE